MGHKIDIFFKLLLTYHLHQFTHFLFIVQDENRYSAGRGAHKNLKRAEKARNLVSKIPCELVIIIHLYK